LTRWFPDYKEKITRQYKPDPKYSEKEKKLYYKWKSVGLHKARSKLEILVECKMGFDQQSAVSFPNPLAPLRSRRLVRELYLSETHFHRPTKPWPCSETLVQYEIGLEQRAIGLEDLVCRSALEPGAFCAPYPYLLVPISILIHWENFETSEIRIKHKLGH
jgi:hypothetical protein